MSIKIDTELLFCPVEKQMEKNKVFFESIKPIIPEKVVKKGGHKILNYRQKKKEFLLKGLPKDLQQLMLLEITNEKRKRN